MVRQTTAVIFDMDGVLIDSEPFWHEEEMAVFGALGVPLTPERCLETTGLRPDEVVRYWHQRFPWDSGASLREVEERVVAGVQSCIRSRGRAMPGVLATIRYLAERDIPMAVASSSPGRLISAMCARLGLETAFRVLHSAEDEPIGKPHPGVYLTTAAKLSVEPGTCLAVEDSVNGVLAAKAARMRCLAVPAPAQRHDRRLGIADLVIDGLDQFQQVAPALLEP